MSLASRVAASAFHRILTSSVSRSRQFRRPQQSATVSSYVRHVMLCAVCLCQWHSSLFAAHSQLIVASFTGMAACSIQQAFCGLSVHACDVFCVVRPDPGGGIQISYRKIDTTTHRNKAPIWAPSKIRSFRHRTIPPIIPTPYDTTDHPDTVRYHR